MAERFAGRIPTTELSVFLLEPNFTRSLYLSRTGCLPGFLIVEVVMEVFSTADPGAKPHTSRQDFPSSDY